VLLNEGVLLAKSVFIFALYACPSSGWSEPASGSQAAFDWRLIRRGVGRQGHVPYPFFELGTSAFSTRVLP
jgi:hypothetical protein